MSGATGAAGITSVIQNQGAASLNQVSNNVMANVTAH